MHCNCQEFMTAHGFSAFCRTSRCSSWAMSLPYRIGQVVAQELFLRIGQ